MDFVQVFHPIARVPARPDGCITILEGEVLTMVHRISRRRFAAAGAGILAATSAGQMLGQQNVNANSDDGEKKKDEERKPVEAPFERDYPAPKFKPKWAKPQINRVMAQDFVIYAHSDLAMVKKLLDREPGLLNATMDWGNGDWETGLGGASHMGRKDIVKFLLGKGARIDIFCATMMGMLGTVKEMLTLEPELINAKGPHGFTLQHHAQVGQEDAKPVLDYLQSIKEVELRDIPFLKKRSKPPKKHGN